MISYTVYGFHYYFFYKRIIKIEIFEAPLRHEKYLRHFAEVIYGSNSMSYMKTKENQPQFRKLLLYPDELRRHADIMYKTRQNILQAKFFLPALFSARQPRLHPRSASTPATRRGLKRHEIFPVYSCQPANFKLLLK